jgi:hypothetical protein
MQGLRSKLMEAEMKGLLVFLRVAVVGFALLAGGRALYRNRDKLKGTMKAVGSGEALKSYADGFSVAKLLGSVGSVKNLVGQLGRFK